MKLYLAGPISSNPDGYRAEFAAAADKLRTEGYEVINPAENPEPPCKSWAGYMRLALAQLVTADGIALLPNWRASRGALLEERVAAALEMEVIYLKTPAPSELAAEVQAERE